MSAPGGARPARPDSRPWWDGAVVYEVYLRSFADSDADGVGDLPGLRRRLDYLVALGVDALWISPCYPSPMADHGYDVADYRDIDPRYGSLADFDALLCQAHAAGLRILLDLVPNHTSSAHPWFRAALADPASPLRARYIFRPPGAHGREPNAWTSVFGGSAWTRDPSGQAYYLHLFDPGQPDLNWFDPQVRAEFEGILTFWLDRGVDGFRIDVAHGLVKDPDRPGPPLGQPETVEVFRRWREICDGYGGRLLVGEMFLHDYDPVRAAGYVGPEKLTETFDFTLTALPFQAAAFRAGIQAALAATAAAGGLPAWVLSNHDLPRHATRYGGGPPGVRRARAATALLLGLPGTVYLYQGEELGLEQADVPPDRRVDPIWTRSHGRELGRDGARTPLPWTTHAPGYGFTTGVPWLPFGRGARAHAVTRQARDAGAPLSFYRTAVALRRQLRPQLGDAVVFLEAPPGVLALWRPLTDGAALLVALNTNPEPARLRLSGPVSPPAAVQVLLTSEPEGAGEAQRAPAHGELVLPGEATVWVRCERPAPSSPDARR